MTKNEKLTLIFSGIAILLSILTFGYTVWRDFEEASEKIHLDISQRTNSYEIEFEKANYPNSSVIASADWTVTITNNSSIPVSIINYDLYALKNGEKWYYTGLDHGITDLNGEKIEFPITIPKGHARRYRIHVGYQVKDTVFNAIPRELIKNGNINNRKLRVILAKRGLDLWGNEVKYNEEQKPNYLISIPPYPDRKNTNFLFELTTGRRNNFSSAFGPYFF